MIPVEVVSGMVDGMIQIVENVPRILFMTAFKPLVAQTAARAQALALRSYQMYFLVKGKYDSDLLSLRN